MTSFVCGILLQEVNTLVNTFESYILVFIVGGIRLTIQVESDNCLLLPDFRIAPDQPRARSRLPSLLEIVPGLVESGGSRLSARYATCTC
jgi:hypothetical protein